MAVIALLVLVALAVAVASAVPQLARGGGVAGATPDLARLLGRRVGLLLLVVVAFVVALGNGQAVSGATYALFAGIAALIMAGLGALWLYRDQESA